VHRNKVARKKASVAKAIVDMQSAGTSKKPAAQKESPEESE